MKNKFRAWDKAVQEMYYMDDNTTRNNSIMDMVIVLDPLNPYALVGIYGEDERRIVTNIELMQYTGLKDKNGTEIYEGDILKIIGEADYSNYAIMLDEGWEFTGKVVFNQGTFEVIDSDKCGFSLSECLNCCDDVEIEIIGNIYEIGNF